MLWPYVYSISSLIIILSFVGLVEALLQLRKGSQSGESCVRARYDTILHRILSWFQLECLRPYYIYKTISARQHAYVYAYMLICKLMRLLCRMP